MKKKVLALMLSAIMLFASGCGKQENTPGTPDADTGISGAQESTNTVEPAVFDGIIETSETDMFTDRDYRVEYEEKEAILIQLNGDSATSTSAAVQVSGSTVTIEDEGTYVLRGNLKNGMIIVNAEKTDKLQLVLEEVTINSETSAPLYVQQADKVFVTLAEGTTNTLSNGGCFEVIDENDIDAVIYSKDDLTLNGLGSLLVTSPVGHGIISKDDLVITSGAYTIQSASHGLDANDSVRLINAAITIDAGKDGIHAENADDSELGFMYVESGTYHIEAEGDGISAGAYLQIENGSFDIMAGGGSANATKEHSDEWGMFGGGKGGHGMDMKPGQGGTPGQGRNPGQGKEPGQSGTFEQGMEPEQGGAFEQGVASGHGMNPAQEMATDQTAEGDDDSTSMKAIKATGNITINDGSFILNSADDAVHSNASVIVNGGSFGIATGDDAFHADDTLNINEGAVDITESYEGLEALHIDVNGGDIKLVASDDGLNAAGGTDQSGFGGPRGRGGFGSGSSDGTIQITAGSLYINASGDGIDVNGTLDISGGTTIVCGPTRGDTAILDYDSSATITGGTFIGTGAIQMAQTFSDSTQGVVAVNAGNQTAGSLLTLTDERGNTIVSYEPALDFSLVILSSSDIVKGEAYTMTIGEASGEFTAS